MKPTKGRIVHFVLANGETRAAIVTNAFPSSAEPDRCNLTVNLDLNNDLNPYGSGGLMGGVKLEIIPAGAFDALNGTLGVGSAKQDEEGKAPGTWHWPPRE